MSLLDEDKFEVEKISGDIFFSDGHALEFYQAWFNKFAELTFPYSKDDIDIVKLKKSKPILKAMYLFMKNPMVKFISPRFSTAWGLGESTLKTSYEEYVPEEQDINLFRQNIRNCISCILSDIKSNYIFFKTNNPTFSTDKFFNCLKRAPIDAPEFNTIYEYSIFCFLFSHINKSVSNLLIREFCKDKFVEDYTNCNTIQVSPEDEKYLKTKSEYKRYKKVIDYLVDHVDELVSDEDLLNIDDLVF